jgi:hypothetical protein
MLSQNNPLTNPFMLLVHISPKHKFFIKEKHLPASPSLLHISLISAHFSAEQIIFRIFFIIHSLSIQLRYPVLRCYPTIVHFLRVHFRCVRALFYKFFLFDKLQTSQTPLSSRPLPKTRQRHRLLRPVGAASTSASSSAITHCSDPLLMLPWLGYSIVSRLSERYRYEVIDISIYRYKAALYRYKVIDNRKYIDTFHWEDLCALLVWLKSWQL